TRPSGSCPRPHNSRNRPNRRCIPRGPERGRRWEYLLHRLSAAVPGQGGGHNTFSSIKQLELDSEGFGVDQIYIKNVILPINRMKKLCMHNKKAKKLWIQEGQTLFQKALGIFGVQPMTGLCKGLDPGVGKMRQDPGKVPLFDVIRAFPPQKESGALVAFPDGQG